jgi:hypothetical protein
VAGVILGEPLVESVGGPSPDGPSRTPRNTDGSCSSDHGVLTPGRSSVTDAMTAAAARSAWAALGDVHAAPEPSRGRKSYSGPTGDRPQDPLRLLPP